MTLVNLLSSASVNNILHLIAVNLQHCCKSKTIFHLWTELVPYKALISYTKLTISVAFFSRLFDRVRLTLARLLASLWSTSRPCKAVSLLSLISVKLLTMTLVNLFDYVKPFALDFS